MSPEYMKNGQIGMFTLKEWRMGTDYVYGDASLMPGLFYEPMDIWSWCFLWKLLEEHRWNLICYTQTKGANIKQREVRERMNEKEEW